MNTLLKLAPLLLAIGISSGMAVELGGLALPAALEPLPLFLGFVMSLTLLTALADYARPARTIRCEDHRFQFGAPTARVDRADQPLAA